MVKISSILKKSEIGWAQMSLFVLIELLLIFGDEFVKFHIYGPIHLYDGLFILLSGASFLVVIIHRKWIVNWSLITICVLAIGYLGLSVVFNFGPFQYIGRQFAVFIYLIGLLAIYVSIIDDKSHEYNIRFIIMLGIATIGLQVAYLGYSWIFNEDFHLYNNKNYFSKMAALSLITSGAYLIVRKDKLIIKFALMLLYLILCISMGHASAFLAGFFIIGTYVFLSSSAKVKVLISFLGFVAIILLLLYVPSFSDHNTSWRILYWKVTMRNLIFDNYALLGNGFGVKYTTLEVLELMKEQLNSPWFGVRPEEQYTSPMHNSFITLGFHIGLIPAIALLMLPLKKTLQYLFNRTAHNPNPTSDLLVLSLLGAFVWAFFNVILELPHSSAFFWLIYFSTIYQFGAFKDYRKA